MLTGGVELLGTIVVPGVELNLRASELAGDGGESGLDVATEFGAARELALQDLHETAGGAPAERSAATSESAGDELPVCSELGSCSVLIGLPLPPHNRTRSNAARRLPK